VSVELIQGDILTHAFAPGQFDLVYSVGVLAEHTPLTASLVDQVWQWLRPGGRFAFTTVHPDSASIPRTVGRTVGRLLLPITAGTVHRHLHDRITAGGLYADEALVRAQLEPRFDVEALTRMESEAHLHCLCVARKSIA
jgi:2-polyprenyl-3-methyl-5-hydroxy-6-metoxy-1,4-benzoquinol methylase